MKHILSFKRLFEGLIKSLPVLDAQKVLISNLRKKFGDNRIKDCEANVYYDGGVIVLTVEVTEKTDGDLIDKILSSVKLMDTVGWLFLTTKVMVVVSRPKIITIDCQPNSSFNLLKSMFTNRINIFLDRPIRD